MSELGKAYVQIVPVLGNDFGSNLESTLEGGTTKAGDSAGSTFGSGFLGSAGKVIAGGAAALGAATAAAVTAVVSATNAVAEAGDTIDKTSQKLGVSASEYQALAFAAEHCGFETSTYNTAVRQLQESGYEGTLYDYLNALQEIEDPAERAAAAQEMLGDRTANQMAAYINGEESMSDYMESLDAIGGLMSDEAVAAAATYEDSLTDLHAAFAGIKTSLVGDFMPSITEIMDGLTGLMSGDSGAVGKLSQGLEDFCANFSSMIPQISSLASSLIPTILKMIVSNLPMLVNSATDIIVTLCNDLIALAPQLMDAAITIVQSLADCLIENIPMLMDSAVDMIISLAEDLTDPAQLQQMINTAITLITTIVTGLINAIPKLIAAAPTIIKSLATGLINSFPMIISAAGQLITTLGSALSSAGSRLLNFGRTILINVANGISGAFSNIYTVGSNLIVGLWNGIGNKISWITSKIQSFGSSVINSIKGIFGIHSPSKVFAEIGGYMAEGLGVGWDESIDGVESDITGSLSDITGASWDVTGSASASSALGSNTINGGVSINVYGANGQSVEDLAQKVMDEFNNIYARRASAWA